jgi:hypothetical protein
MNSYMFGKAVHDAMAQACGDLAQEAKVYVQTPDNVQHTPKSEMRLQVEERRTRPGPRYGVDETTRLANALKEATRVHPETYPHVEALIAHAYRQSGWIEKVWRGLVRAAQEAER